MNKEQPWKLPIKLQYTMKMTLGNQSKPFNIEYRTSTRQHKEKLKFEES